MVLSLAPNAAATSHGPHVGEFFEYTFHRHVGGGGGEYYGYSDDTNSRGRYEVVGLGATGGTVQNHYSWTYSSNEGQRDAGTVDRTVGYTLPDRRYTGPLTDYDELDDFPASAYTLWWWISPDVRVGERVQILDGNYTVVTRDGAVWLGGVPRVAIELRGTGTGFRDDLYGRFGYTWSDTYFFDAATGMFLQERYVERDSGTWQGEAASFTLTEDVDFTRGSYDPPVNVGALVSFILWIVAFFALMAALVVAYQRRPRTVDVWSMGGQTVKVRRLRRLKQLPRDAERALDAWGAGNEVTANLVNRVTEHFQPFLEDFANKALRSGDRVYYAYTLKGLVGLALYNEEAKIGTVMAKDTGLAEVLRKSVGAQDFFSEWRHPVPASAQLAAEEVGMRVQSGDAYNIFDTYNVLKLDSFPRSTYDTELIRPMRPEDLGLVSAVAKEVFRVDSAKWIKGQFESGDVGFVAQIDRKIVGFAFATFANGAGRLHSLAVLPGSRNRGVGRELVRARLNALEALGATFVISEIAQWNLASLHLAYSHGFKPVGQMFVESARRSWVKRDIVRR
jgi:L-amino acid N-acyltransferase YncA